MNIEVQSLAGNILLLHAQHMNHLVSFSITVSEDLQAKVVLQISGTNSSQLEQVNLAASKVLNQYKNVPLMVHFVCSELIAVIFK